MCTTEGPQPELNANHEADRRGDASPLAEAEASGPSAPKKPGSKDECKAEGGGKPQGQPWRDKKLPIAKRVKCWNKHLNGVATAIRRAVKDVVIFGPMTATQAEVIRMEAKRLESLVRACRAHEPCGTCNGAGCHACSFSGMLTRRQSEIAAARRVNSQR